MIKRIFTESLLKKIENFPIVTILGPRQCGKTTLIKNLLPDWKYLDLEKPSDFTPLAEDTEVRIKQLKERIVFDEAQQLPSLFPVLRSYIDENRDKNGQFVLLGSASPHLIKRISESLAGRTAFMELTPFLYKEVFAYNNNFSLDRLWFRGGFPDAFLLQDTTALMDWFEGYTRTFIERDLNLLGLNVSSTLIRRLWAMLAHLNGKLWNASQVSSSLGVNYQTVNRYTDILEQTFLIQKLQPYYINIGKRIIKSPKLYFRDTGLLHYFLGIHDLEQLYTHPARGLSWEAFTLEQIKAIFKLFYPGAQSYFWRTSGGAEVDLLIETRGRIIPFEIKLHSSPSKNMLKGLLNCMNDLKLERGYVIYPGKEEYSLGKKITVLPIDKLLLNPEKILSL